MMQMKNQQLDPPFLDVHRPQKLTTPVVFSSPHSGRRYPPAFIDQSRLKAKMLRRSEDSFVDEIFSTVPLFGAPLIRALFPRAYIDVNREPFELDPEMFDSILPDYVRTRSPRIAAGLGTIPKVVANGAEIYAGPLKFSDARKRIDTLYRPYHGALQQLLNQAQNKFGVSLLIDCHSMPSQHVLARRSKGLKDVDIVLGDNHNTTCAPEVSALAERILTDSGFRVTRNRPYAGGYITRHYGEPEIGHHSLQIEINRALYMDERRIERSPRLPGLIRRISRLVKALTEIDPDILKPNTQAIPKAAE